MKLITSLTSPFGRKIRMLLIEKSIACEVVEDVPWNADSITPQYNPLGKIPVLVRDDGSTLFDSRVIALYLDGLSSPAMIPADGEARIQVLRSEALADGISDAAAAVFIERKRDATQQSPEWIARQLGKVRAGLKEAESLLRGDTLHGDFSLADITLVAALEYVQLRLGNDVALDDYPGLVAYLQTHRQRRSVEETRAPG